MFFPFLQFLHQPTLWNFFWEKKWNCCYRNPVDLLLSSNLQPGVNWLICPIHSNQSQIIRNWESEILRISQGHFNWGWIVHSRFVSSYILCFWYDSVATITNLLFAFATIPYWEDLKFTKAPRISRVFWET